MRDTDTEFDSLPEGWWGRLVEWSFQPRILITVTLAVFFIVIIPSIPGLRPSIGNSPQYRFSPDRIDLTEPTEWVPHGIARQVADSHPEWKERSLLDTSLAADLAAEFRKHPWIASVDRVEKTRQGRVKVEVTYRNPVAVVETFQGLISVDAEGVVLPSADIRPSDWERLPRLKGIRSSAAGLMGKRWNDPLLISGVKLCAALIPQGNIETYWKKFGLLAVVAPDRSLETAEESLQPPVFELLTQRQRRIIWGHPPDVESYEPGTAKKLDNLSDYVKRYKSLDLPVGQLGLDNRRLAGTKPFVLERADTARQPRRETAPR